MASDEKLMALKKAYADIILNTAKEAAARIMASERKAQSFQRELQLGKDEALRMLLRLKQMMDAKIADAESMSMSQQKKIDELEAQLQEAEDIVKDLREELREVQSELDHLRNKRQYLDEQNGFQYTSSVAFPCNSFEYVAADDLINTQFRRNERFRFYSPAPPLSNPYFGCPDLPSIILRSKEPELYRNGCTQRIRASSEGNFLNKELSDSRKISKGKDVPSVREDICNGGILSEPSNKIGESGTVMEKETNSQFDVSSPVLSFCTTKKRANRYRKKLFSSFTSSPDQISCSDQAAEVSNTTSHLISARSDTDADVNLSSASGLSPDTTECGLETTGSGEASTNERDLAGSAGSQSPVNGVTELVATQKISTSADTSEAAVGANLEKVDTLLPPPEACEYSRPVTERVIKYTFQRKRKRESLAESNGDVLLDKHASKTPAHVSAEDQPLDGPVEDKLNLITKSSPESPKLAQIASQLLSLSETVEW